MLLNPLRIKELTSGAYETIEQPNVKWTLTRGVGAECKQTNKTNDH